MGRIIVDNPKENSDNQTNETESLYKRADDFVFEDDKIADTKTGDAMTAAESLFIDFVSKQVTKMDQKLLFDGKSSPPLQLIDRALMQHEHVMLALTALYEQARWKWNAAKEAFTEWEAVKFLEVRNEVNRKDEAVAKWYKKEEIDRMVIVKYRKEYAQLKAEIQLSEAKVSLFRRLIDSWNSYAFQLGQLSRNGIAEKTSSDLSNTYESDDNVNSDPVMLAKKAMDLS